MVKKILVVSSAVGTGHVRAADAITQAAQQAGIAEDVQHVDMLDYCTHFFRYVYRMSYVGMVQKLPWLYGWLYRKTDVPWRYERRRLAMQRAHIGGFLRLLEREKPDVCICTHFLPAETISWLIDKGKLDSRHLVVVTDLDVHAMWMSRQVERYFVAIDESKQLLVDRGIESEKVTISGIPIDRVFSDAKDKQTTRQELGLDIDRSTLLLSAGGDGFGPVVRIIRSLLKLQTPAQVVVICGNNRRLKSNVETSLKSWDVPKHLHFVPLGYTNQMHQYMAAADLMVGKTGGLATSEALARGLPYMAFNTLPGQEQRNADYLLENGAAWRCNNLATLAWKIDKLLGDPKKRDDMRQRALKLAHPEAAHAVVNYLKTHPHPGQQKATPPKPVDTLRTV